MDTKPLERFAKDARRALIAAVSAQASAVLAPGSVARTERGETVRQLETEIAAHSHGHVIDKVAYTWFNRLVALRFMDAKGYTGSGVVSPGRGQEYGQPEILADAKRGDIDADVVTSSATRGAILGLLDGSRRSTDAEGEAYALLLTEYCRYWHKPMPFMFEREGDYTELLVPAGLLADGGIVARARNVLTEEVCDDVEVIGWLYQFYISERKQQIFDSKGKRGAAEIPAATQLFTPHWIVRYLVENSVGRLWMLNRPTSQLTERMDYYLAPVDDEADFLKLSGPEELTVIDPACGSGHMLTYAFDLLYAIYEEVGYPPSEIPSLILTHNLHGTEIDPRAGALAAFALTMKARAKDRRFFSRSPIERGQNQPKICVIEPISFGPDELDVLFTKNGDRRTEEQFWNQCSEADTLGALIQPNLGETARLRHHVESLDQNGDLYAVDTISSARRMLRQAEILSTRYAVAVENPPYLGAGSMDSILADYVASHFKPYKGDLFSAFVARTFSMVEPLGLIGVMTPNVWMYISTHEKLRRRLLQDGSLVSLVELPLGGFQGATVQVCAFVCAPSPNLSNMAMFVSVVDAPIPQVRSGEAFIRVVAEDNEGVHVLRPSDLTAIPSAPVAYWLPRAAIDAYATFDSLGDHSYGQPGLQTSDNARFIRFWFEVGSSHTNFGAESSDDARDSGARWFPLVKGGDFRKWFGNLEHVVNWQNDGETIKASINEKYPYLNGNIDYVVKDRGYFFRPSLTYNKITSGRFTARLAPTGTIFDVAGSAVFPFDNPLLALAVLGSTTGEFFIRAQNPTLNVQAGDLARLPFPERRLKGRSHVLLPAVSEAVEIAARDWDLVETAWGFRGLRFMSSGESETLLSDRVATFLREHSTERERLAEIETEVNIEISKVYGLHGDVPTSVWPDAVTLRTFDAATCVSHLVSYAVGCMFGRYSLDVPGLVLADQGDTVLDFLAKVPSPAFAPDGDNVIPFVDDGWFEDDIVERFRTFLRAAFGARSFEENLRFVEESLGVTTLRDYFITKSGKSKFYDDHVQRYKKRPIYWMFSSPKGSFNALIYLHRYTPSTVSTVLNEYLREYEAKLTVAFQQAESSAVAGGPAKDQKEADRLRKVLAELRDYEHDVLYPLATQQISIDLDDGVKVNYPKFYPALKKIAGLEANDG